MKSVFCIVFLLVAVVGLSQTQWVPIKQTGNHFKALSANVEAGREYTLTTDFPFKGFIIKYDSEIDADAVTATVNNQLIELREDPHWETEFKTTGLVTLDEVNFSLTLNTGNISGPIEVHLINGAYSRAGSGFRFEDFEDKEACDEPTSVPQSVWRDGLPLPNTSRSFTNVKHLIIHHSAGTNSSSDWMEVVRSIYIFHTETRGWSDVGYNYLIDPNGILYEGRDPVGGAQDNVLGAHFCGKNSGTMGTCLMGTYTTVPPTEEAVATLQELLAWKADKEQLNVFGTATHSGGILPHIAGHRDGCSTECPGQMTYNMLSDIIIQTNTLMEPCGSSSEPTEPSDPVTFLQVYPNPVLGNEFHVHVPAQFRHVRLVSSFGKTEIDMRLKNDVQDLTFEVNDLQSGVYTLIFSNSQKMRTARLVIAH